MAKHYGEGELGKDKEVPGADSQRVPAASLTIHQGRGRQDREFDVAEEPNSFKKMLLCNNFLTVGSPS